MENTVVRDVRAPTEGEARTMATPILDAFRAAGWELRNALWVPGDRRPDLAESFLLSPESQNLLEGEGTLELTFSHEDPLAEAPAAAAAVRKPDAFEDIGGVRYRRLVPRWGIGIVVGIIGLLIVMSIASGMRNNPFAAAPSPDGGMCPLGWVQGVKMDDSHNLVPDGTCVRFPGP
jgi:hypothetical protein